MCVTYHSGYMLKIPEHFYSPQHATDIVKRLLHHSGMIIDNATPMAQGHLPGNTRITALKEPIVDADRGISVSIRLLHPSRVTREQIVAGGNATQTMIDFLCMCLRYGVSFVVAGATSSGKTTLLNALLSSVPNNKRIALAIELFTDGSLDTFAKQTNVDVENRLICYDILDLGKQLLPIGMLVVLDSIGNVKSYAQN